MASSIVGFIIFFYFLSKNEYSPSTVKSYISGLSFRMKISGLLDTTNSFIIKQMLLGMQRLHKRVQEDQLQLICSCILLMLYSIRVHQFMKLLYFRLVFHLPFCIFTSCCISFVREAYVTIFRYIN